MKTSRLVVGWASSVGVLSLALVALHGCGSSGQPLQNTDSGAGTGGSSAGSGGSIANRGGAGGATAGSGGSAGGTGGSGGTGGGSGGSAGATGGSGGTGGKGGTGGGPGPDGGTCNCGAFTGYRSCCGDRCLNLQNDPFNCGACGNKCPAEKPFCEGGTCQVPPCTAPGCSAGRCCGAGCCAAGQICCSVEGPVGGFVNCHTPTAEQPTCPVGCAPLCISDRNLKDAVEPVDRKQVLAKLSQLPISRWRYRTEAGDVRHMGPMAQDFKQAFGLGDTDRAYHAVDAHGVAFAAIQALKEITEQQQRRIDRLEREKRTLERRLRALESPAR